MEDLTGIIKGIIGCRDWERPVKGWQAVQLWQQVAGKNICLHSKARRFYGGVLFVEVDNPVWSYHLSLLKNDFKEKLNLLLQGKIVTDIVFRIGYNGDNNDESLPIPEIVGPAPPDQKEKELGVINNQESPVPALKRALTGYIHYRQLLRSKNQLCLCCQEPFCEPKEKICSYCQVLLLASGKEILKMIDCFPGKTAAELQELRPDLGEVSLFKYIKERGV